MKETPSPISEQVPYWLASGLLVLTASLILVLIRTIQRIQQSALEVLQADYQSLSNHAARLGIDPSPSTTPLELSSMMLRKLRNLPEFWMGRNLFEKISEILPEFTQVFSVNRYGKTEVTGSEKKDLTRIYRTLNHRLWIAVFIIHISSFMPRRGEAGNAGRNSNPHG
jgi:hypothetical protein